MIDHKWRSQEMLHNLLVLKYLSPPNLLAYKPHLSKNANVKSKLADAVRITQESSIEKVINIDFTLHVSAPTVKKMSMY